jgi:predicted phosphoribosyltransferase
MVPQTKVATTRSDPTGLAVGATPTQSEAEDAAPFAERTAPGSLLAKRVVDWLDGREPPWRVPLVLALTPAGVPVAAAVAQQVSGELDAMHLVAGERSLRRHRGDAPPGVASRVAIVVHDGLASERTTLAGLRAVRAQDPELLLLATPVCPEDRAGLIAAVADETICLGQQPELPADRSYATDVRPADEEVRPLARRHTTSSALPARLLRWARRAASARV